MAEAQQDQAPPTLSEEYLLKGNEEKGDVDTKPVEVKEVENPGKTDPVEVVVEKTEEPVAVAAEDSTEVATGGGEESSKPAPAASSEENSKSNPAPVENSTETATDESSENAEDSGDQEVAEEAPEIKLETAPVDFRFPTTNQTRHCFTRYIEYHRCVAAKGEGAPECDKFQKFYRSLCPGEWVERWNEQRENGTFPGPL